MQFGRLNSTGSGCGYTTINFEDMSWFDNTPFTFRTILYPKIKPAATYEEDKRRRLDLTWYHWIFFKGTELFDFHSYSESYISEEEVMPTIEQLKPLIVGSYKHLQSAFEEKRGKFRVLPAVSNISPDTIEQTAYQLMAVFLPEQE